MSDHNFISVDEAHRRFGDLAQIRNGMTEWLEVKVPGGTWKPYYQTPFRLSGYQFVVDSGMPECFASRPGPQARAENDCDRCPEDKLCDDVGRANAEASRSCLRTFKERRVRREAVRMERRKGGDRRALVSKLELNALLRGE